MDLLGDEPTTITTSPMNRMNGETNTVNTEMNATEEAIDSSSSSSSCKESSNTNSMPAEKETLFCIDNYLSPAAGIYLS